ncbi:MAG: hypothetical protein A2Z20_07565 [Bdellovibrionales bacterium RBG_16_40_8]|nr:MAG: hypothetical protein A2Z20_07565 [Bdellovibrionales bacterium RBG_16_40_8]
MKKRPKSLLFYSLILVLVSLSLPFQICFLYEVPMFEIAAWWKLLTTINVLVMVLTMATAVLSYQASKKTFILASLTFLTVTFNNWWVGYVGTDFNLMQTSLSSLGFLLLTGLIFEKKAFYVLKNNGARWWRNAERSRVSMPVTIYPWIGDSLVASTYDMSASGVYICFAENIDLQVGDRMQIRLNPTGYKSISCTARLVRKSEACGSYPSGVAMSFENLTTQDRKCLLNAQLSPC